MSALRWDADAGRSLRGAERLFAAADLDWFVRLSQSLTTDPWSALDRLLRDALGDEEHPTLEPPAMQRVASMPQRLPSATSRQPSIATTTGDSRPLVPASAPAVEPLRRFAASSLERVPAGDAARLAPATGAERKVSLEPRRSYMNNATGRAAVQPTTTTPRDPVVTRAFVETHRTTPLSIADIADASNATPPASGRASFAALVEPSYADVPSEQPVTLPARSPNVSNVPEAVQRASVRTRPDPDPARRTRLVEGLPAIQNLLQAAVAESRQRHVPRPVDAAPPDAAMAQAPPPASPVGAPPFRALSALDAVAEDMLVDRLCDRLEERLRQQALRHFGFSGGLT